MERQNRLPILTDNGRRLIRKLADLPPVWLTAAALGESIGVSRRTVMREMPGMEKWLEAAGFRFVRSPGQGVRLDEDEERRAVLRTLLDGSTQYCPKTSASTACLPCCLRRASQSRPSGWRKNWTSPSTHLQTT